MTAKSTPHTAVGGADESSKSFCYDTQIDTLCAGRDLNRSEFINRCIDFAIEHMDLTTDEK